MRILVLSDSHGRVSLLERAIESQPTARHIFFLGDNTKDVLKIQELYPDRVFHTVRGNCDFSSMYPEEETVCIEGVRIFYCHGHTALVKHGTEIMLGKTEQAGAKIGLFGHTHSSSVLYDRGIYLVNPGSVGSPRDGAASYAVIDITKRGIMPIIIKE